MSFGGGDEELILKQGLCSGGTLGCGGNLGGSQWGKGDQKEWEVQRGWGVCLCVSVYVYRCMCVHIIQGGREQGAPSC